MDLSKSYLTLGKLSVILVFFNQQLLIISQCEEHEEVLTVRSVSAENKLVSSVFWFAVGQ